MCVGEPSAEREEANLRTLHAEQEKREDASRLNASNKMKELFAKLQVAYPNVYKLHDQTNDQSWGKGYGTYTIVHQSGEDSATIYVEASRCSFDRRFFVRIKTSGGYGNDWKKNWTFETKDIVEKVHAKVNELLDGIVSARESRGRADRLNRQTRAEMVTMFGDKLSHHSISRDGQGYGSLIVGKNSFGSRTLDFYYRTEGQTFSIRETEQLSRDQLERIVKILQEKQS
jgi:hypothetical protein